MKKILAYLLVAVMVLALPLTALAASNVEMVKNSVARLVAYDANGNATGWGSAIAVGKAGEDVQYFITNNHVVSGAAGLRILIGDIYSGLNAMVVDRSVAPDLAVIRLDKASNLWKPITFDADAQDSLHSSDQVFAVGFPDSAQFTQPKLNSDFEDATLTGGYASSMNQTSDGSLGFQFDAYIGPGSSGGAVVNADGQLVGISRGGVPGTSSNFAIYANLAEEMLKRNMISYQKESPLGTIMIIAVVVAVLLVVAVVVLVVTGNKKSGPAGRPVVQQYNVAGSTMPVKVPEKKKDMPSQRITCIAGPMKGATYDARGSYSFGTSTACSVVIPKGTPGVSGKHCSLRVEDGKVILKDLNSTYGTYINSSKNKLTMNASCPLKRGDTFYLGSDKVGFLVG